MKGKNKIIMCQEEACAAMEYYLTNKLLSGRDPAPKVVSVRQGSNAYGDTPDIEIEVEEVPHGA